MSAISKTFRFFASIMVCILSARATEWWKMPKGSPIDGPGAGMIGVVTEDVPQDTTRTFISVVYEAATELGKENAENLEKSKSEQYEEFKKGIGDAAVGIDVGTFDAKTSTLDLALRKRMVEQLKNSPDAASQTPFITYLESLQAHESRIMIYNQRMNNLFAVNKQKLNWQQRVKLQADLDLLHGQMTLAEEERREQANRMKIAGSFNRMVDAKLNADRESEEAVLRAIAGRLQ